MRDRLSESRPNTKESIIAEYLDLENKFQEPPEIKLSLYSQTPESEENVGAADIVVTTAVQCYAPGEAKIKPRRDERSLKIAESTREAGHHTTRMHSRYTFHIVGASRNVIHEVLHSYPFYNSEQQSQRYVEAKQGNYQVPEGLTPEQKLSYIDAANFSNNAYFDLMEALLPEVDTRMHEMYPSYGWNSDRTKERLDRKTKKICQEVARYVLPISQKSTLYHSIDLISLQRLFYASRMQHVSDEGRFIIGSMVKSVADIDDTFVGDLPLPIELDVETSDIKQSVFTGNTEEFDNILSGQDTILIDAPKNVATTIPFSVRNTLGASKDTLSDEEAWNFVLDPNINQYISDLYDIGMLDQVTSNLRHANFVFASKMSHTAHSQSQRHRRTPSTLPVINELYSGKPDYITPMIVRENPSLKEKYDDILGTIYKNVERAINIGIPKEIAYGLIPNAQTVRVVESGDLFDWSHRLRQRLCLLAQEEIFFVSVNQAKAICDVIPAAGNSMIAPCGIRQKAAIRPRCPEGDRWCGQPVFKWKIDEYEKNRLV